MYTHSFTPFDFYQLFLFCRLYQNIEMLIQPKSTVMTSPRSSTDDNGNSHGASARSTTPSPTATTSAVTTSTSSTIHTRPFARDLSVEVQFNNGAGEGGTVNGSTSQQLHTERGPLPPKLSPKPQRGNIPPLPMKVNQL